MSPTITLACSVLTRAWIRSLAEQVRHLLERQKGIEVKRLFGGVGFLLLDDMTAAVWKSSLIVRLGVDDARMEELSVITEVCSHSTRSAGLIVVTYSAT